METLVRMRVAGDVPPSAGGSRRWLGRLAQGAFWFFLAKGLLWLTLPVAAWLGWGGLGG